MVVEELLHSCKDYSNNFSERAKGRLCKCIKETYAIAKCFVLSLLTKVMFTFSPKVTCTSAYLSTKGSVRKLRVKTSFVVQLQSTKQELGKQTEVNLWMCHLYQICFQIGFLIWSQGITFNSQCCKDVSKHLFFLMYYYFSVEFFCLHCSFLFPFNYIFCASAFYTWTWPLVRILCILYLLSAFK